MSLVERALQKIQASDRAKRAATPTPPVVVGEVVARSELRPTPVPKPSPPINPNRIENITPWLDAFHTRILGSIQNRNDARNLNAEHASLESLNTGTQFALREGDHWLRFWIPSFD